MSDTKNFDWDGFAKLLRQLSERQEISSLIGEQIAESPEGAELFFATSLAVMNVTALSLPVAAAEGEDWWVPIRAMCEAHGMEFLGASLASEFAECLVVVRGCGLFNKAAIEALWRELDSDLERSRLSAASE
jgi:hypothetical protein